MLAVGLAPGDTLVGQRQPQEPRDADAGRTRPGQHEAQVPEVPRPRARAAV